MKILFFLLFAWLVCGLIAGALIMETRPITATDVELGPISLARHLLA